MAAVSAYVDPITTKEESVEVFVEVTESEEPVVSQIYTLEAEEEEEDFYDPDPLSYTIDAEDDSGVYYEEVI